MERDLETCEWVLLPCADGETQAIPFGTDFGNGKKRLLVWVHNVKYLVVKIPTTTQWAGLGMSDTYPGYYWVGEVVDNRQDRHGDTVYKVKHLIDIPLSQKGRERS